MSKFRVFIIVCAFFLGLSLFGLVYALHQKEWYAITIGFSLLSILWTYLIIRYTERWKRSLTQFIQHLQNKDFNVKYSDISKQHEEHLKLFDEIIRALKEVRIEKELHYRYLQNVFEHAKTAMICFDRKDSIELMNTTARKMFGVNKLSSLKQLDEVRKGLYKTVKASKLGNEDLFKLSIGGKIIPLSIKSTSFKLLDKEYHLVSFSDISMELDIQEMDSWKKLIRVLTHEIMNSVTPITSLTSAMQDMIKEEEIIENDDIKDIEDGLNTIEKRSRGLLKFVDLYKQFYRLPKPSLGKFKISSLANHINTLMFAEMETKNIGFSVACENDIEIEADFDMLQQVIINLLINAMEAVKNTDKPKIELKAGVKNNKVFFRVKDNGKGIEEENKDQIFIPFFSTKQDGSGIGLSLSRQIVQLHRGNIAFNSMLNKGSEFTVWLG